MSPVPSPARTIAEFAAPLTAKQRLRGLARGAAVWGLSLTRSLNRGEAWIAFPYYHHVFDDERRDFERQLDYLKRFAEPIDLDDAVSLLASGDTIDGRYFCVTFDDGFRNVHSNATPILVDAGVSASFFLPTSYMGTSPEEDGERLLEFFEHGTTLVEFLSWDEAREMVDAGMSFGSHTVSHLHLSEASDEQVESELAESKRVIENELGQPCLHFCCPFGHETADFTQRHVEIARKLGYRSFLSTDRGRLVQGDSPELLRRDHILAGWGNHQLRYFLGS